MAFLSDVQFRVSRPPARSMLAKRRRLNWRLLLALVFNLAAWIAIVRAVGALF